LVEQGDINAIAKYAIDLLSDQKKLTQFKANAYNRAKTFSIENTLDKYEALYERVYAETLQETNA
jgi:glycosyltransferase involved in cell wall biosynthesis